MRHATVLTIEAMFVVYAVLTNSEEDEEEEPTIKRPDRGLLKRTEPRREEFLKEFSKCS